MGITYRQCHMTRPDGPATVHYTAWLPAQFAKLGSIVRLRRGDGPWSGGWRVSFVSTTVLSEEVAIRNSRAYLKQRKASDI